MGLNFRSPRYRVLTLLFFFAPLMYCFKRALQNDFLEGLARIARMWSESLDSRFWFLVFGF